MRASIFGIKPKSVIVDLDDGTQVEVRQQTVGQVLEVTDSANVKQRMAKTLIASCFVPGTSEPVFEEADFEQLMEMPAGSVYMKLMQAIDNTVDLGKQEKEAKNG